NPAMTIAQAVCGMFPWANVLPYIVAQLLGALVGQLIVYVTYLPHYNDALCCLTSPWGEKNLAGASIVVGFVVWGLVTSMGGPTGPALNPARDLMPRLLHAILPIPHKGSSRWGEAWIPVVAPIAGAILGVLMFKSLFA
ncbi:MAG: aquaporin, partial [Gardnerella vaginalis]